MSTNTAVETYNYANFGVGEGGSDFASFRTHLPVGSRASDFTGTSLDTMQPTRLSEFWKGGDLLIEFGSLT